MDCLKKNGLFLDFLVLILVFFLNLWVILVFFEFVGFKLFEMEQFVSLHFFAENKRLLRL